METKMIEKNWTELKGKIKARWSRFNDEEIESLKGDISQLTAKIQKTYSLAKVEADRQFEDFKKTVASLISKEETPEVKPTGPTMAESNIAPPELVMGSKTAEQQKSNVSQAKSSK